MKLAPDIASPTLPAEDLERLLRGDLRRLADRRCTIEEMRLECAALAQRYAPAPTKGAGWTTQAAATAAYVDSMANPRADQVPLPIGLGLNRYVPGIPRGVVTLLYGRPGEGKSIIKEHMIEAATAAGHRVLHVTLEDNGEQVGVRAIARATGLEVAALMARQVSAGDIMRARTVAMEAAEAAERSIIWDTECAVADIAQLANELVVGPQPISAVYVDHVGALDRGAGEGVMHASQALAALAKTHAKKHNIAWVILAHFQPHGIDHGRRPGLHDVYGGQALSQPARLQLATHIPSRHGDPPKAGLYARLISERGREAYDNLTEVIIRKNWCGGNVGLCIPLVVDPVTSRMTPLARAADTIRVNGSDSAGPSNSKG